MNIRVRFCLSYDLLKSECDQEILQSHTADQPKAL